MSTDYEPGWRQRMLADLEANARQRGPVDEEAVATLMAGAIRLDREEQANAGRAEPSSDTATP